MGSIHAGALRAPKIRDLCSDSHSRRRGIGIQTLKPLHLWFKFACHRAIRGVVRSGCRHGCVSTPFGASGLLGNGLLGLLIRIQDVAEGEGFEPPKACTLVVFKTTAIDHSAIPPATSK